MNRLYIRVVTLLALTLLVSMIPVQAWSPPSLDDAAREAAPSDESFYDADSLNIGEIVRSQYAEETVEFSAPAAPLRIKDALAAQRETAAAQTYVPGGATPGFYAARDYRNLDPTAYSLVGSHQSFFWEQLEPTEGEYNWAPVTNFVNTAAASGKKAAIGIITFNARANEGVANDPPIRTPRYVFDAGAGKIICPDGDGDGQPFEIPKYWDPIYQTKYEAFISAFAAQFDGDPNIEYIQIGVGKFGETQPCDDQDNAYVSAALAADGHSDYTWPYIVNDITDIYDRHFSQTQLLLPNAPRFKHDCDRRTFSDHAISKGIGLFPAGLYAIQEWIDMRTKSGFEGCGKYDRILDHAESGTDAAWVPLSFEMYDYMIGGSEAWGIAPDPRQFFWAVAAALSRRVDYITMERNVLYEGQPDDPTVTPYAEHIEMMRWASQYMGKHLSDTPSVWVLMREAGYASNFYPQKGNYSFWLQQDDSVAGGQTVPTTYRTQEQLVYDYHWTTYGTACVNAAVETSQGFLDPAGDASSREGWICRRTNQAAGNTRMWFKINDNYVYGGPAQATFTVTYLDRGTDSWQIKYDGASGTETVAGTVTKTNSGQWREAQFTVADAMFSNRQLGGSDFYLDCMNDGNEYIHMVDVTTGASGNTQYINLTTAGSGWNMVSINLTPGSSAIADVLASISGKYDLVYAYQSGTWRSYTPGVGGDLTTIDPSMGLWIHVTQNCTLTVTGTPPTSTTISLSSANGGWNLIGWPSNDTRSVATALAGIAGNYDMVYQYVASDTADPWKIYNPAAPSYANDLTNLSPGTACWIKMNANRNLTVDY